jgi:hypothetical protein
MKVASICMVFLCLYPVSALAEMNQHPGAAGGCADLPPQLRAVVTAMETPGMMVQASARPGGMAPLLPAQQRIEVVLHPAESVALTAVRPDKTATWAGTFAGLLRLQVPHDGIYRISADASTWIDVLDHETAVARIRPNYRLHRCGHVHKSVEFSLRQGVTYLLQLSGSKAPTLALMISGEE